MNTYNTDVVHGYRDVGIVCMMNYNIGNNLTNYALYYVIKKLGYTVKMIDMPSEVRESGIYLEKGSLFYFLRNPYNEEDLFKPSNRYELYAYSDNCGMYLVASDQLWRDKFVVDGMEFFSALDWVPSYKYKLSYATSTGTGDFDAMPYQTAKMKGLLRRFNKISVRETFGQNLLKKWGLCAKRVLDPVFLCDKSVFDDLADKGRLRIPREKYVAAYLLDASDNKEKIVQKMAELISDSRYVAMTEPIHADMTEHRLNYTLKPHVEEWVSMIKNSEFVITDSFHGMCFALIYEKPFWVVFNPDCWRGYERFIDLLSLLGLEDRILEERCEITIGSWEINYEMVNAIFSDLQKNSEEWLREALKEGMDFIGTMETYDYCLELESQSNILNIQANIQNMHICEQMKKLQSSIFFQKERREKISPKEIREKKSGGKTMVIGWGAGYCFRKNIDSITKYSEIKYVCDSNPDLWGTRLANDIICISPAELLKFDNPMVLIMVENGDVAVTIANTLLDMGIANFEHIGNWIRKLEGISNDNR